MSDKIKSFDLCAGVKIEIDLVNKTAELWAANRSRIILNEQAIKRLMQLTKEYFDWE